ncbi:Hypothetical protein GLP15_388 [Giardia lamblia P15]|uniref:Uncharacterized protein n=1 Tax=Giardia intestinalis (strain P15) TaxID=658858 RepID=E1EXS5_GIAIA|nr:Hypothetical protein GLP15_388 [Giardia lamblia P15]
MLDSHNFIGVLLSILPVRDFPFSIAGEGDSAHIFFQSSDKLCYAKLILQSQCLFLQPELEIYNVSMALQGEKLCAGNLLGQDGSLPTKVVVAAVPLPGNTKSYDCYGFVDLLKFLASMSQAIVDWSAQMNNEIKHSLSDILSAPISQYKQLSISHQAKIELLSNNVPKVTKRLYRSCREVSNLVDREAIEEQMQQFVLHCNACTRTSLRVMKHYQDSISNSQNTLFSVSGESLLMRNIVEKLQAQLFIYQAKIKTLMSSSDVANNLHNPQTLESLLTLVSSFYDGQITRQAFIP